MRQPPTTREHVQLADPLQSRIPLSLAVLAFLVFCTFSTALRCGFLYWDDNIYVFEEPLVTGGDPAALIKVFAMNHAGNHYPITLASFWMEHFIWGLRPALYHATNILLHIINTVLACWLLFRLCGNYTVAWIAALLFAVHPQRVEAVCWISSRKDLLCTIFYIAAMLAHLRANKPRSWQSLAAVFLLQLGALMCKATAVTLPVTLLLLDWHQRRPLRPMAFLEKIPLFALSIIFGLLAIRFQHDVGATDSGLPATTFPQRIGVACFAVFFYAGKVIVPTKLAAFYLYPVTDAFTMPSWFRFLPFVLVPAIAAIAALLRRERNALFGIAFFFVTIGPLLQVLSVGAAIAADRYTYLPSVGLAFAIVLLVVKTVPQFRYAVLGAVAITLAILSTNRIPSWMDTETLMTDQIQKFPTSVFAWNDRGVGRMAAGDYRGALADYTVALSLRHDDPDAKINIERAKKLIAEEAERHETALPP